MPAETIRAAARLYATGGNAAIYYGLGVTEHSQGSTTVMAIANLAMATGNIGRPGVGVNPLRGQNNVQGSCDMGSFPHELPGYRHVSDDATRAMFEALWGVHARQRSRACASPTCSTPRSTARSRASTSRARTSCSPIPTPSTSPAGLAAMECVVVQDLFLNETANYAHVFLPGSTFLEKDGTFTNAERRIQRVRKVMAPRNGYARLGDHAWLIAKAMGFAMHYNHPSEIMDEIARADADLRRRLLRQARRARLGAVAVQRQGAGGHAGHAHRRLRARQGQVRHHRICRRPTRRTGPRFPLLLTTGRILSASTMSARRPGAPTTSSGTRRTGWKSIRTTPSSAASATATGCKLASRAGETTLRALITERVAPGVVYTTFHHPDDAGQRRHHRLFRLGDQLPGIQGDGGAGLAVERPDRMAGAVRRAGTPAAAASPPVVEAAE